MSSRKILTISLSLENIQFLDSMATEHGAGKSSIVEKALDYYRRYTLKKGLIEGFSVQDKEDKNSAMSDFADYLTILDEKK